MDYISTRGSAPALDFAGATLAGLASDGGLYVPRTWPRFTEAEIAAMAGLPYAELAQRIMQPFVEGSLSPEKLLELTRAAYGRFAHADFKNAYCNIGDSGYHRVVRQWIGQCYTAINGQES